MKNLVQKLIPVLIISLFLVQCAQKEETIVEVGSLTISKSDIIDVLMKKYPNQTTFTDVDLSVKKDLLEPLIVRKLYLNEAREEGLANDPDYKNKFEKFQIRILGSKYFERTIVDQIITDEMLDDAFSKQGVELKASHILIAHAKSPRAVKRSPEEAKKEALEVVQRLKNGDDFTVLVEEFSDDPSAKSNKGDLGYFIWGKMVPAFYDAAWTLEVGQISEPVETTYGFHIIRLDDKRPLKDYVENRDTENLYRIKQTLMRAYNDSARVLWKRQYQELLAESDYQLFADNISEFADTLKTIIKDMPLTVDSFPPGLLTLTFAEWDGDAITVASLREKYETQLPRIFGDFRDATKLKAEIDRISMDSMVLRDAKRIGIDQDETVAKELKAYSDKQMENMIENRQIRENTKITDAEILAYYEKHPDSFLRPVEIEIWEIDVTDEKLAKELALRAKKGEKFEALARKYAEDKQLKKKSGYLGYKNKTSRGSVSQEAHKLGPGGKIGGPVKYGRYWAVLKTGNKHDEAVRPLEEVSKRISNLVKNEKIKEAKLVWERELQESYKVSINEEKLKEI